MIRVQLDQYLERLQENLRLMTEAVSELRGRIGAGTHVFDSLVESRVTLTEIGIGLQDCTNHIDHLLAEDDEPTRA